MDIENLNPILEKLVTENRGIQDAVLVSSQAKLITNPLAEWDKESIMTMAAQMLYLTDKTSEHLGWPLLEQMWLQGGKNYFIGIRCSQEVLLLVKAINDELLGLLEIAINRTVKQLDKPLNSGVVSEPEKTTQDSYKEDPPSMQPKEEEGEMWRGKKVRE